MQPALTDTNCCDNLMDVSRVHSGDFVSDKLISIIVYLLLKTVSVCIELGLKTFTVQLV